MYDLGKTFGFSAGLIAGLVVAIVVIILLNKNHKLKSDYDERQEMIRGKSYKYGFFTVMIYEALMLCLSVGGFPNIAIEQYVFHTFGIFLGITVYCAHAIMNGAYWARNNNVKTTIIVMIVLFVINVLPVIAAATSGITTVSGYVDFPFINLFCSIMIAVLGVVGIIRHSLDVKEEQS